MNILVITTGGTIGALAYPDPKKPPAFASMPGEGKDLVKEAFEDIFPTFDARCLSLPPKDSKEIEHNYRWNLLETVIAAPENFIIITHGTDTITETADFFFVQVAFNDALLGKKIILTGSMTPLANGPHSDGYRNLAFALDRLANPNEKIPPVGIVLSAKAPDGKWEPHAYPHRPQTYRKNRRLDGAHYFLEVIPGAIAPA